MSDLKDIARMEEIFTFGKHDGTDISFDTIKIFESREDIIVYNREMYEDIGNDKYLMDLKEYKEFRNFLKEYYWFDINEDELLRGEIVDDYIDSAQFDEKEAINNVKEALDRYFDINEFQKIEIIKYIDKIRKRMPIWKQGGRIDNTIQFPKVGRNEPCPCRIR